MKYNYAIFGVADQDVKCAFFKNHATAEIYSLNPNLPHTRFLEVIINLIGNTTSQTGLKVYAMKDRNTYPTKRKISDKEMDALNIFRNDVFGKWNYKIKPRKNNYLYILH